LLHWPLARNRASCEVPEQAIVQGAIRIDLFPESNVHGDLAEELRLEHGTKINTNGCVRI
jgi:hypothetical protein